MKKNKKLSDALGVICVAFIFAGCVEGMDGGITAWTFISLALAGVTGWLSRETEVKEDNIK